MCNTLPVMIIACKLQLFSFVHVIKLNLLITVSVLDLNTKFAILSQLLFPF